MAIKAAGTLGLSADVVAEFGGTAPHDVSEYYRGAGFVPAATENINIPTSGRILFSNFYGSVDESFVITTSSSSIEEGSSATFLVNTTGIVDGTKLYWTSSGSATAADFTDSTLTGSVTIVKNAASFTRTAQSDLTTEGTQSFNIQLRTGSISGTIVSTSSTVQILDKSITPPVAPSITFSRSPATIYSGDSATLSWSVTNATRVEFVGIGTVSATGTRSVSPTYSGSGATATTNYELLATNTTVTATYAGNVTQSVSRSANVSVAVRPALPTFYTVTYKIIGGGGGGGAGREDDGGSGAGIYAGTGGSSTFSVNNSVKKTATGGTGGRSFANRYDDFTEMDGKSGWFPNSGGRRGGLKSRGSSPAAGAWGSGGGGGGGDSPSRFDSSGNGGRGGAAGNIASGTINVNIGDTIKINLGAGGQGHFFRYWGAPARQGYAEISFNGNSYAFSKNATLTVPLNGRGVQTQLSPAAPVDPTF
jgi:hypothetical protein